MKDSIFTAKAKKRELIILLISFIAANILNLIGIIKFKTSAIELISQVHVVILVTLFIYMLTLVVRIVWYLFTMAYKKIKHSRS